MGTDPARGATGMKVPTRSLPVRFALAALICLLILAQSGCGGGVTPAAPPPATSPASPATAAPTEMPTPEPTPTSDCRVHPGRVDSITYPSLS
jgi:hypothetical protein